MPEDKNRLLSDLKRNKKNRSLSDAHKVLKAFGFTERKASKEGAVWQKGSVTLTLPKPHGGNRVLKVAYVSLIVREIERAETLDVAGETEDEQED